jgi:ubiquinone/menaquinone biosynthesis C-methylase UbiE
LESGLAVMNVLPAFQREGFCVLCQTSYCRRHNERLTHQILAWRTYVLYVYVVNLRSCHLRNLNTERFFYHLDTYSTWVLHIDSFIPVVEKNLFYLYYMKDNFSKQADVYAKYRPNYPKELYDFILNHVSKKDIAWDCATGNGQAAKELSAYFNKVEATDISQKQLDKAVTASNIIYSVQPAEQTNFAADTFDLITVSQALHWFNFEKFYSEITRVAKPGAWLAVWMYSLLRISPAIDAIVEKYHFETLRDYWDSERKYVDNNYTTIPFPFPEIKTPAFSIVYHWTLEDLAGYFNTWSALQKYMTAHAESPVPALMERISGHWTADEMKIVFPLHLRMGEIKK